nr:ABC transporter permease subunit [Lachnospiraceae bacterium]
NTLCMSGLGIATSWVAIAFAVFLSEIKCGWFRRIVQVLTTVPNFISWVLVYAIALAIFATDGFLNGLLSSINENHQAVNYLMGAEGTYFKMLAWGMWKGLGWSAIIYIAAISGIDQQLYEAATVDGAGRFQKMWHVTIPGLIPTYCVLLLMSIAGILSNGMDQYLVFENANNTEVIQVLDLYVYKLGIGSGQIPLSTVVGMLKTIVSVTLLFLANGISKLIRGESIM